jgi:hypothetical protein
MEEQGAGGFGGRWKRRRPHTYSLDTRRVAQVSPLRPRILLAEANRVRPKIMKGTDEGFRACVRTRFPNSVPQGRLSLAQDASPGYIMQHDRVPQGRLKGCPGLRRGPFSAVPVGLGRPSKSNPGLASWAKLSRPCGTEFAKGVLTHVL